jgi:hypothetical protein
MSVTGFGKVEIGDAVLYQEVQDEVVLLNMANQQYYGLDDVGARMWKSLLESGSVAEATVHLCQTYEVEETVIRSDLEVLVRDLLAAGLLKTTAPQPVEFPGG